VGARVSGSAGTMRPSLRGMHGWRASAAIAALLTGMLALPAAAQQSPTAASQSTNQSPTANVTDDAPPLIPLCTEFPELVAVTVDIPEPPELNPVVHAASARKDDEDRGHEHAKHENARRAKYDVKRIGEREIGRGMNIYSLEREQALGRELAGEIESQSRMVADPVVTEYVNRIGQTLVRNSDARVPFTIKVVDNDEVNAFALPGGFFYVNTGLILAADNEAELAGVMAHEIAHVAARHATKNATRAQIWNIASIPLIFMGGPAGYAIREIASLAVPMSFLKFSRDAEREADLLGVEYEYAAGYDPVAFVQFFEKLRAREKEKHSFIAKAFTTHPMTADRIKRAQDEIATMLPAKDDYIVDTSEFEDVKARLSALILKHEIEAGQGARPTLRRRGPDDKSDSGKDNGPVLKKRTD
jgi:predicted Zn-dependent protease